MFGRGESAHSRYSRLCLLVLSSNVNVFSTDGFALLKNALFQWTFHFALSVVANVSELKSSTVLIFN